MTTNKVNNQLKVRRQHHLTAQRHLHIQLPEKIMEAMLNVRRIKGVTIRQQIMQALELKGMGI